ncbi:lipopolysaccharide biosynthesis protein [uncultured Winogradskyella sp.]|uniref:lipopolysaccharide biosynthesis protein n=1 Tax=uncultured Winogradskyella sp. TaxID=395353 RepID=UPI0030D6ED82|tara:strand:+ start:1336 stop:2763 length:1428 start_codon:yes stop_codon:yes gene_type:complete
MSKLSHYSWSAVNKFGTQTIGFVGNILIARQLSPEDYGLIAMLAIFLSIAMNFTESGFADFLIRDPNSKEKDFATIFVHNIVFGIGFYFLLFFCAPLIASFYKEPELISITRVLGLSIIFKAICLTEFTRMRKELLFKNASLIQIVSSLVSVSIAYIFALLGWGYWALVIQAISLGMVNIIMIIAINKWTPVFHFNWSRYRVMRKFGNNMLLSYFTNQIGSNLYSVFVGKFYNSGILGYYNQAEKINKISFYSVNSIILTTSYSLLAKEIDKVKRRKMYVSISNHFLFIHFIFSAFIIGGAYPIIEFLFGEQWIPTVPFLQLILLSFLFQPLVTLNSNIIKIENNSKLYRNLTFLRNGLILLSLLITYTYTIYTILYGLILARYFSAFVDAIYCGKYIDFRISDQLKITIAQALAPSISSVIAYFVIDVIATKTLLLKLVLYALVFGVLFIVINRITRNKSYFMFLGKIKTFKIK